MKFPYLLFILMSIGYVICYIAMTRMTPDEIARLVVPRQHKGFELKEVTSKEEERTQEIVPMIKKDTVDLEEDGEEEENSTG
jgi:hypothetical protein